MQLRFLPSCTLAPGVQDGGLKIVFLCLFFLLYCTLTSVIHSTAMPCQQDKTVVVKQSKQTPLMVTKSPWCDLQTGFLLLFAGHSLTKSAVPDKELD